MKTTLLAHMDGSILDTDKYTNADGHTLLQTCDDASKNTELTGNEAVRRGERDRSDAGICIRMTNG